MQVQLPPKRFDREQMARAQRDNFQVGVARPQTIYDNPRLVSQWLPAGDNTLILRETMKDLEKRLDPRRFQRVHRSCIVNLDQVRQVKPHTNGECFWCWRAEAR